jgi:ribokinase
VARIAVIGHVEWLTHSRGELPPRGEIVMLEDSIEEPAGGGGVSAVQVANLGAECLFYTALGDDETGQRIASGLAARGVRVLAAPREGHHARALSITGDGSVDRTIFVMDVAPWPMASDPLPWKELATCEAVYFTGRDPETLRAARAARHVVVTGRRRDVLEESGVRIDLLVASAADPAEAVRPEDLPVPPGAIVWTEGGHGGHWRDESGREGRWAPATVPGEPVDAYGCGDCFVAGVTVGLGRDLGLQAALELGARCGATCLTGRGGLGPQLRERI